jgi:hypothetical protein
MERKRIGAIEGDVILTGGLLVGIYLFVAKPLMNMFGSSADDEAKVKEVDLLSPTDSPFSSGFGAYRDLYQWASPQQETQFYVDIKNQYDDSLIQSGHQYDIARDGETVNDAFGFWHNARVDDVMAVFKSLQRQTDVSEISAYLMANYGKDLWTYLKDGYTFLPNLKNGLSDKNLAIIANYIENLPE